jgi:hypothetical protein
MGQYRGGLSPAQLRRVTSFVHEYLHEDVIQMILPCPQDLPKTSGSPVLSGVRLREIMWGAGLRK